MIKKILDVKFLAILNRHNNPVWARQELEHLIYNKHYSLYLKMCAEYRKDVDDYMDALRKIHGGV